MTDDFIIRLVIHITVTLLFIRGCYYTYNTHRAHASAFIAFGSGVFIVTAMLHNAELSMGFAFGLFAVFSMLRYRTESISVKEMTYLFLTIALSLLNAVADISWLQLILTDLVIVTIAFLLETNLVFDRQEERELDYDIIENIRPENRQKLLTDLKARTGWDVISIDVIEIDFIRDRARLRVCFSAIPGKEQKNVCREVNSEVSS